MTQPFAQQSQHAPAAPSKALSITSLIIGVVSLAFGYTFLVPIAGIVVGVMAKKREPEGRTMANWGIGLSIAAIALGIILIVVFGGIALAALGIGVATGS